MPTLKEMLDALPDMSTEDLRALNQAAYDILQIKREMRNAGTRAQLRIGQSVSFRSNRRYGYTMLSGMIVKINQKTAKVDVNGQRWTVSLDLLKTN